MKSKESYEIQLEQMYGLMATRFPISISITTRQFTWSGNTATGTRDLFPLKVPSPTVFIVCGDRQDIEFVKNETIRGDHGFSVGWIYKSVCRKYTIKIKNKF